MGGGCSDTGTYTLDLSDEEKGQYRHNDYSKMPDEQVKKFIGSISKIWDIPSEDIDAKIKEMWKSSMADTDGKYQAMKKEAAENPDKFGKHFLASQSVSTWWFDEFRDAMVYNIANAYPYIAKELTSRPMASMAATLSKLMTLCMEDVLEQDEAKKSKSAKLLLRIGGFHTKWRVEDSSYITVENACMHAVRVIAGSKFTPKMEVRLRYKFNVLAKKIMGAQIFLFENGIGPTEADGIPDNICPFVIAAAKKSLHA